MSTRRSATTNTSTKRNPTGFAALGMAPLALGLLAGGHGPANILPPSPPNVGVHAAKTPTCGPHCGTERWPVKTLSDVGAAAVRFTAVPKSVSELVSLPAPDTSSDTERLNDIEKQTYTVHARLIGYKQEFEGGKGDHDFHIVIQDLNSSETMIVEIPDPQCDGVCNSIQRDRIVKVRSDFANAMATPPGAEFVVLDDPQPIVDVTGVGFFDFFHGQVGVATNCLELHPVLAFQFPSSGKFTAKHDTNRQPAKTTKDEHSCIPE